jgi:hypothetical protein
MREWRPLAVKGTRLFVDARRVDVAAGKLHGAAFAGLRAGPEPGFRDA